MINLTCHCMGNNVCVRSFLATLSKRSFMPSNFTYGLHMWGFVVQRWRSKVESKNRAISSPFTHIVHFAGLCWMTNSFITLLSGSFHERLLWKNLPWGLKLGVIVWRWNSHRVKIYIIGTYVCFYVHLCQSFFRMT